MDKNQVYRFVVLTHPYTPLEGPGRWGRGVNCRPSGSCVKMELVDMSSGGRDWFPPSVVVVLTAPRPGGADKKTGMKETSRGVDCISRPGISPQGFF